MNLRTIIRTTLKENYEHSNVILYHSTDYFKFFKEIQREDIIKTFEELSISVFKIRKFEGFFALCVDEFILNKGQLLRICNIQGLKSIEYDSMKKCVYFNFYKT